MEYVPLGSHGLMVSRLAFGNSLTHGNQIDDTAARACVHTALDAGVTTFDTADVYAAGRAETVLGDILQCHRRSDLVICTKVGRSRRPNPNEGRLSRKHIRESADASLSRLRTEYIDLYQAHRFDEQTPLEETMSTFADLVRAGKVLYVGVSDWSPAQLRAGVKLARELQVPLIAEQTQYSMLWRGAEGPLARTAADCGVGLMAWSPLAGGVLTGKYRPGRPPPSGSRVTSADGGATSMGRWNYLDPPVLEAVARLRTVAESAGMELPVLALAWTLRNRAVSTVILGASRPEQLAGNLRALDVDLDDDLVRRADEALAPVVNSPKEETCVR